MLEEPVVQNNNTSAKSPVKHTNADTIDNSQEINRDIADSDCSGKCP